MFICINTVHPGKVSESEKCILENETKWQYYGTPSVDGTLTVKWDPSMFKENTINIEVWGYEETGNLLKQFVLILFKHILILSTRRSYAK